MRASTNTPLINALRANTQFVYADLYTLTLKSGDIITLTNGAGNITWNTHVYNSFGPYIKRTGIECRLGTEIDQMTMVISADITHTITVNGQTIPFLQSVMRGDLDGCIVLLERIFMPTYGDTSLGSIILFQGYVTEPVVDRLSATITVSSMLEKFNMQMPRNLYQPACRWNLFDAGCAILKTSFQTPKLIAAGGSSTLLNVSVAFANGAPYYDGGTVTFTSGHNIGVTRTIKQQITTSQLVLNIPLPYAPAVGDGANFYPGCDKTQATCSSKFSNLGNFSGEPFVPVPETAI